MALVSVKMDINKILSIKEIFSQQQPKHVSSFISTFNVFQ